MSDEPLSPAGQQRKEQILGIVLDDVKKRSRRRLAAGGGAALLAILAALLTLQQSKPGPVAPSGYPQLAHKAPPPKSFPTLNPMIQDVVTDPTISVRFTIPSQKPLWAVADDKEFLRDLAASGQPAALASIDGKAILLPQ